MNGVISSQGLLRNARELDVHLIPPAFERIFQSPKWLGGDKVKHVIEPRIDYKLRRRHQQFQQHHPLR